MSLFLIESAGFEQFTRLGEIRGEPGGSGVSAEGADLEVGQQTEHRESRYQTGADLVAMCSLPISPSG
jgi:hypothetical protein